MIDNGGALGTDWEVAEVPVAGLAGTPVLLTAPSTTAIESSTSANVVTIGDLSLSRAGQPTGAQVTPTRLPQSPEAMTITHSASQTIMDVNSIACNDGLSHSDNSYLRAFTLADFGIYADFTVSSVDIGIESASGAGGVQPVTVNLYTLNGPLVWANMTLIGTVNTAVSEDRKSVV